MSSSVGMMIFPRYGKIRNVPILKPLANIFIEDLIEDDDFMEIFWGI